MGCKDSLHPPILLTPIFDFGGVLIDLDFNRILNAFRKIGFDDIDDQLQTYEREGIFQKFELGEITANDFRIAMSYTDIGRHIYTP